MICFATLYNGSKCRHDLAGSETRWHFLPSYLRTNHTRTVHGTRLSATALLNIVLSCMSGGYCTFFLLYFPLSPPLLTWFDTLHTSYDTFLSASHIIAEMLVGTLYVCLEKTSPHVYTVHVWIISALHRSRRHRSSVTPENLPGISINPFSNSKINRFAPSSRNDH